MTPALSGPLTIQINDKSYDYQKLANLEQYEATVD